MAATNPEDHEAAVNYVHVIGGPNAGESNTTAVITTTGGGGGGGSTYYQAINSGSQPTVEVIDPHEFILKEFRERGFVMRINGVMINEGNLKLVDFRDSDPAKGEAKYGIDITYDTGHPSNKPPEPEGPAIKMSDVKID